jgi:hypothetical protein
MLAYHKFLQQKYDIKHTESVDRCTDCDVEYTDVVSNGAHYFTCTVCGISMLNHDKNECLDISNNDMVDKHESSDSGKAVYSASNTNYTYRSLYNNSEESSDLTKRNNLKKELKIVNKTKLNNMLPIYAIEDTIDFYFKSITNKTKRKNNKNKILGASIQLICRKKYKINIADIDICVCFEIDRSALIEGRHFIEKTSKTEDYSIDTKMEDSINSYLDKFFVNELLLREFVLEMYNRINSKRIVEITKTQPLTRIIALIVLAIGDSREITHEYVRSKGIELTEATYKGIITKIYNYEHIFRKTFKKYKIPLPKNWLQMEDYSNIITQNFEIKDPIKLGVINACINRVKEKSVITDEKSNTLDIVCLCYILLVKIYKYNGIYINIKTKHYRECVDANIGLFKKLI